MHYGFGYSPDSGRHFIVTLNVSDPFPLHRIHGIGYLGEFYLHDPINGYIFRFQNFGASFSYENLDCEEIDGIEPGAGRYQLFLMNNAAEGCYLYTSENGGSTYTPINFFPQVTIKPMAYERESGILYLLGFDNEDSLVCLYVSNDNGQSFNTFVLDAQLQTPYSEQLNFKLLPTPDGTVYLFLATNSREHQLYESDNNLQNCTLVWQYTPLINEWLDMLWTGVEGAEFLLQHYYWHMAFNRLEYSISSDEVVDFQSVALYNFYYSYQNPVFLVPTASITELTFGAGSVKLYVRSNADWQISCDADWVSGFSQVTGNASADVFMNYQANLTGNDRSCVVHFQSAAAPDTFLVLTQSGNVSAADLTSAASEIVTSYPNPFNNSVNINGRLPHHEMIEVNIYNIRGEIVRVLKTQSDIRDEFSLVWDANDSMGRRVASGVYLCRLKAGSITHTIKLLCW